MYSMEWSLGVEYWSGVKFWSGKNSSYTCIFSLGTVHSMEWSLRAEFWSRVLEWSGDRFWSGKSRMECSCDVCV